MNWFGGQKTNPCKKPARRAGKIEKTWVGPKPKNSATFDLTRPKKKQIIEKYKIKLSRGKGSVTTEVDIAYQTAYIYPKILIPLCTYSTSRLLSEILSVIII